LQFVAILGGTVGWPPPEGYINPPGIDPKVARAKKYFRETASHQRQSSGTGPEKQVLSTSDRRATTCFALWETNEFG
jgi:hypothetical protein